jgi:hypothetical protein
MRKNNKEADGTAQTAQGDRPILKRPSGIGVGEGEKARAIPAEKNLSLIEKWAFSSPEKVLTKF